MTPPRLLVLSGAGLPAWIWDKALVGLDHHVVDFGALTGPSGSLAAGGKRAGTGGEHLADYARTALSQAPWPSFTLVAHSVGGVVAAELCGLAPERVDALFAVSAVIPETGSSFVASMPAPQRFVLPLVLRLAGTRPPGSAVRRGLASHLDAETADRIVADLRPESQGLFRDPVARPAQFPEHCGYVVTTEDAEVPEALQVRFARNLGVADPVRLVGGHLVMLERPDEFRTTLDDFLAG